MGSPRNFREGTPGQTLIHVISCNSGFMKLAVIQLHGRTVLKPRKTTETMSRGSGRCESLSEIVEVIRLYKRTLEYAEDMP